MKNKTRSYARFYAQLNRMAGDREEIKKTLVERFTNGRTSSLREMRTEEYEQMCRALDAELGMPGAATEQATAAVKRYRSAVLRRLQKIGIDTTDWAAVDAYCLDRRIAGKPFAQLTVDELKNMQQRLEAILHKRKAVPVTPERKKRIVNVPIYFRTNVLPS